MVRLSSRNEKKGLGKVFMKRLLISVEHLWCDNKSDKEFWTNFVNHYEDLQDALLKAAEERASEIQNIDGCKLLWVGDEVHKVLDLEDNNLSYQLVYRLQIHGNNNGVWHEYDGNITLHVMDAMIGG